MSPKEEFGGKVYMCSLSELQTSKLLVLFVLEFSLRASCLDTSCRKLNNGESVVSNTW